MTNEEMLAEVDELLRTMPPRQSLHHYESENFAWLGRVAAVLRAWDMIYGGAVALFTSQVHVPAGAVSENAVNRIVIGLHEARHNLIMKTEGPSSVAVAHGGTFRYFDEMRRVIETATSDILFVDQYLDAEFVSRYLGSVKAGVHVRLLTTHKLKSLLPAVQAFSSETALRINVRSSSKIHDRFVFVDRCTCYQSGASFKDGARNAPTVINQIIDAFEAMYVTYEALWDEAKAES